MPKAIVVLPTVWMAVVLGAEMNLSSGGLTQQINLNSGDITQQMDRRSGGTTQQMTLSSRGSTQQINLSSGGIGITQPEATGAVRRPQAGEQRVIDTSLPTELELWISMLNDARLGPALSETEIAEMLEKSAYPEDNAFDYNYYYDTDDDDYYTYDYFTESKEKVMPVAFESMAAAIDSAAAEEDMRRSVDTRFQANSFSELSTPNHPAVRYQQPVSKDLNTESGSAPQHAPTTSSYFESPLVASTVYESNSATTPLMSTSLYSSKPSVAADSSDLLYAASTSLPTIETRAFTTQLDTPPAIGANFFTQQFAAQTAAAGSMGDFPSQAILEDQQPQGQSISVPKLLIFPEVNKAVPSLVPTSSDDVLLASNNRVFFPSFDTSGKNPLLYTRAVNYNGRWR